MCPIVLSVNSVDLTMYFSLVSIDDVSRCFVLPRIFDSSDERNTHSVYELDVCRRCFLFVEYSD